VTEGGRLVIEHGRREGLAEASGPLARIDERRFGDTTVTFYILEVP
jgi:16S rRNA G966 N2-methylase RsmD